MQTSIFFLTNLLGLSTGILFWRVWEKFNYKRRIEKDSYQQKEREFTSKSKAYEQELKTSQNKVKVLESGLADQKKVAEKLHQELINAQAKVNREKQNLQEINNKFERAKAVSKSAKEENQLLFQQLTDARIQTQGKWQIVASLQDQLDSNQQSSIIDQLQHQLKQAIQEASKNQKNIEELTQKLGLSSQFLKEKENEYQTLAKQFSITHENLSQKENNIRDLQVSLEAVLTREKQYLEKIERLKNKTLELEAENQQLESSRRKENISHRKKLDGFLKERDEFINSIVDENDSLREEKDKIQSDLDTLESENQVLKLRLIQLKNFEAEDADSAPQELLSYVSITEVLLDAQEKYPVLEIWDSAFKSAYTMNHYLPNKVHESLKVLSQVGQMYFENTTHTNLAEIFRQAGFQYAPRESSSTVRLYGDDRLFHHRGKSKQMFRHLKLGKLRLYFEFDRETDKVQVGYCGKHLRIANS